MKTFLISFLTPLLIPAAVSSTIARTVFSHESVSTRHATPWSAIDVAASKGHQVQMLAVTQCDNAVVLHCSFQRLDGRATTSGLWLTPITADTNGKHFQLKATGLSRASESAMSLCNTGAVRVMDSVVRWDRPSVTEEYSVSVAGIRQDFIISQRLSGRGKLHLELALSGVRAKTTANGAEVVLENTGREFTYHRLNVEDAKGKKLSAGMKVTFRNRIDIWVDDAGATYPVYIDPTFSDANWVSMGGFPGANGSVYAAITDASGNVYVGGNFTMIGNTFANRVAKWDGTNWFALGSGVTGGTVSALATSGNNLYVGGSFTNAGGNTVGYIAKWDGHGWSSLGSGVNDWVKALAVSGNEVYAGGTFSSAGGIPASDIAKWDGNGWSALGSGVYGYVNAIAISTNGDLYVGGVFSSAGGNSTHNVAKWDGSQWLTLGSGLSGSFNPQVCALAVSGGDVYAGGFFSWSGAILGLNNVAKWDGNQWVAVGTGVGNQVFALAIDSNTLYATGDFTTAGGNPANHVAKWNGRSWSAIGSGLVGSSQYLFRTLTISGPNLYVGGSFNTAGGTAFNYICTWDGNSWNAVGSGLNDTVYAVATSSGNIYAAIPGGNSTNGVVEWNGNGWSSLGVNGGVFALASDSSNLYAGGNFTVPVAGGNVATNIAEWNGTGWSALGSGVVSVAYAPVYALAVSGSNVYAGGSFTNVGGISANNIAKWDGQSWSALGLGMNNAVMALAVSGNEVYAGGGFGMSGGNFANCVAKWDGTNWSALGTGIGGVFGADVYALAASGSNVYAGGYFTTAGGILTSNIACWNGTSWSALGLGLSSSEVLALAVSDGNLYVGGGITMAGDKPVNFIAKWDGSTWSALGSGLDGYVRSIATSGADMYVGGAFTLAGGKISPRVAEAIIVSPANGVSSFLDGGDFVVQFDGTPGSTYTIESTPDISPVNWQKVTNIMAPNTNQVLDTGLFEFRDTTATSGLRFYRTVYPAY